jgi:hypothetical protein
MLAAHEERFQRIYTDYRDRPSGDYAELLRRGEVMSREGVDPEEWRAEIRRKARQDKVHVMTSSSGARAFATLNRPVPTDPQQVGELLRRASAKSEVLGELAERSRALGHELIRWLRHDDEYISYCERCGARIYTRLGTQTIEDGEALADACFTGTI